LILLIFCITFGPFGNFLKEKIEWFIEHPITSFFSNILTIFGASNWAQSLVLDGIVKGVGAVISFLPQVAILFTLLFLMEDSGYMARAAFIMDKLLRKIGLSGRAFVPILMGFGCTVSAVMGTRILENEKDKRLTIFMIPFMSCSAKMTIYALLVPTFFSKNQPIVIFSLYVTGIIFGILSAFLLKKTILKGPSAPFIMELPLYRLPSFKSLWLHVFDEIKDFLTKAGTVLVSSTIIIWFFNSFDFKMQFVENSAESMIAHIAAVLSPIFIPCGLGDWRISLSLMSGLIAKESVVSTMQVLYKSQNLQNSFSPLSAYAFLVFILLYVPCIAAISTIKQELANIKWTLFLIAYQLIIAWCASTLIFQIGRLVFKV
jgi:ferrous iron transport protein B